MAGTLGLDLAKTTGCAWIGDAPAGQARPWEIWKIEIGGARSTRGVDFFSFQKQLDQTLRDWKPELVVFEEVTFIGKGIQAYRLNAILSGIVMVRCESFAIPYVSVGVQTLKAFARRGAGTKENRHPTKEQMAELAREKLFGAGHLAQPFPDLASADEVDALWTAWFGVEPRLRRAG